MTRSRLLLPAAVSVLLLAACADRSDEPTAPPAGAGSGRYETDGTVLESPGHGPQLCLGGVAESYPPQCTGMALANWDWNGVEGEESASGTTWGEYHVIGTFDGMTFTVLDVGAFDPPSTDDPDFTPPCPEPAGGWVAPDPSRATDAELQALVVAAEGEPDSAGFWIDCVGEPTETPPPETIIAVAAFTGDPERHEAELRELWGGPLCVTRHERTLSELEAIQSQLSGDAGAELGLETLQTWVDVVGNVVHVGVVVADEHAVIALEERYGAGVVQLEPALTPVAADA